MDAPEPADEGATEPALLLAAVVALAIGHPYEDEDRELLNGPVAQQGGEG